MILASSQFGPCAASVAFDQEKIERVPTMTDQQFSEIERFSTRGYSPHVPDHPQFPGGALRALQLCVSEIKRLRVENSRLEQAANQNEANA
jgi:hypothetical protein